MSNILELWNNEGNSSVAIAAIVERLENSEAAIQGLKALLDDDNKRLEKLEATAHTHRTVTEALVNSTVSEPLAPRPWLKPSPDPAYDKPLPDLPAIAARLRRLCTDHEYAKTALRIELIEIADELDGGK